MRKYILSILFVAAVVTYGVYQKTFVPKIVTTETILSDNLTSSSSANVVTAPINLPKKIHREDREDDEDENEREDDERNTPVVKSPTQTTTNTPVNTPSAQPQTTNSAPVSTGQYKDGTYTGQSIKFIYGNFQVAAVVSGGKLTDVKFLDYPQDRDTSIEINTKGMPYWRSEAIRIQTAKVDILSGATDSTEAFNQSLESALVQA